MGTESRARGTPEASGGQQFEITRFRCDDRWRHRFLRAGRRIEAGLGIAADGPDAASGLRQNKQKHVRRGKNDNLEQQLAAGLGDRWVAELIEDDEVAPGELFGRAALASGAVLGVEVVD